MSSQPAVALRDLSFSYDTVSGPLISGLNLHLPEGFTGVIGANGAGKTTLLRVLTQDLMPLQGVVEGAKGAIYCEQRTDTPPALLADFLQDSSSDAYALRGRLGLSADFYARWHSLSHGERKKAQIGCALWQEPRVLAIDEPTNHIDTQARDVLLSSLERFRGVGLIVSHDRDLLDDLCSQCLWLEPPSGKLYSGGYSRVCEQRQFERDAAIDQRNKAVVEKKKLQREVNRRREQAAKKHRDRSKKDLARNDSDGRAKIDLARMTDGKAGNQLRQLGGRFERANETLAALSVDKDYESDIWLPGSRSKRDWVAALNSGECTIGDTRRLQWPDLLIQADARIAITGPNGAGKSTLVQQILAQLNVPLEKTIVLPQEVSAEAARSVLDEVRKRPRAELGHIMNVISRLGSRPERLLASRSPSPGEVRKLLLATGMSQAPHFIVMDEPTNHLDLPSIQALESALKECPCALLLVSHDQRFLAHLGVEEWCVEVLSERDSVLRTL